MEVAFKMNLILLVIVTVILIFGVLFVVRGVASRQNETRRRPSSTGVFVALGIVFAVALVALVALFTYRSVSHRREVDQQQRAQAEADLEREKARLDDMSRRAPPTLGVSSSDPALQPTMEASTTDMRSFPVLGIEQVLRPRRDFEAWKEGNALASSEPGKPWAVDAAGSETRSVDVLGWTIHGRWPGPTGQIVGYSGFDEADSESAIHTARHSAQHHLKALLLSNVADFTKGPQARNILRKAVEGFERKFTDYVLEHETDRLVQKREGSVGYPSYRAAVLVDAGKQTFEPFAEEFRNSIVRTIEQDSTKRHESILAVASALGLALVVFLLYSFLNAGTKGHFAWPLRIISIGTLVVLYLGLMFLQGWFPL